MTKKHFLISAPGRTEISGNHTDHQRGCVLAAAVNLETVADVMLNGSNNIRVRSEGFPEVVVELDDLNIREEEKNTSAAWFVASQLPLRSWEPGSRDSMPRPTQPFFRAAD